MSSLHENHLIKFSLNQKRTVEKHACWELLECANVLCPVHGKKIIDCWLIEKTRCSHFITDDFFDKLASCLTCSYFKAKGEAHHKGWNGFVAEQLRMIQYQRPGKNLSERGKLRRHIKSSARRSFYHGSRVANHLLQPGGGKNHRFFGPGCRGNVLQGCI